MRDTINELHLADADPMTLLLATTTCITTMDLDVANRWDNDPRLCTVTRAVEPEHGHEMLLKVNELDLPPMPDGSHPIEVLQIAAEIMREHSEVVDDVDLIAWMFVVEAWMLVAGDDVDELTEVAHARKIHLHPDRMECRIVAMVDRTGRVYQTMTQRGSHDEPTMLVSGTDDTSSLDGAVIDALRTLMDATPVTL
jgi:hypothetical protein